MKQLACALITLFGSGTAIAAELPLFAAKCADDFSVDTSTDGTVYINGKVAKVIERPDGQISANSAGLWVDITPQGMLEPRVTFTDRDKNIGECRILSFKPPEADYGRPDPSRESSSVRAGRGDFDAHAPVRCAMQEGSPMVECQAAVARDGGGSATVAVTRPDGRKRFIFFEQGKAIGADLSEADGSQHFRGTRRDDMYLIEAGHERYEFVEALVFGG